MAWDVMSGVTKTAWDVMSGVTKTAWDVLSGVANLCGMFCPGWQKMAWDVLSRDFLSGSRILHHWALGKLNSMGSWCTKLSDYMGGWCPRKLNSMGGLVKKRSAVFLRQVFFFWNSPQINQRIQRTNISLSISFNICFGCSI